jgi:V8-like Glu-specific endopeptidase
LTLQQKPVQVGDELYIVGHPAGLPTKIAGGAVVRSVKSTFFKANLDSYGGNSGSAVFNAQTNEIVGILVRGDQDFKYDQANSCTRSNICENDGCRGEDVTNITYINDALNKGH